MKIHSHIRALQPNQVGILAWSLLALPEGGIPHQPDPDPAPDVPPHTPEPSEPGEPLLPDDAPPTPIA